MKTTIEATKDGNKYAPPFPHCGNQELIPNKHSTLTGTMWVLRIIRSLWQQTVKIAEIGESEKCG